MSKGLRGSTFGGMISGSKVVPPIPIYNSTGPIIPLYEGEEKDYDYIARILTRSDVSDPEGLEIQERVISASKTSDHTRLSEAYLNFTKYFYARGKYSDALNYIDMRLNLMGSTHNEIYAELRGMRGVLHSHSLKLFEDKSIEEDLDVALEVKKSDSLFLRKKAVLSDHQKKYSKSSKLFEKSFGTPNKVELRTPDEIEDYQIFLKNLAQLGGFKKLYAYCKRGLELIPDNETFIKYREEAVIQFAKTKQGKDFFGEAKEILQKRLERDPHNPTLIFDLASVQMAEGTKDLAIQNFGKLIESGKDNHEAHFKIGNMLVYGADADQNLAMQHYIEVLESEAIESGVVNRDSLNHHVRTIISRFAETVQKLGPEVSKLLIKKIEELDLKYPGLVDEKRRVILERSKSVVELFLGNKEGVNISLINDKLKNLREGRAFGDIVALTDRMIELEVLDSGSSYIRGVALAALGDFKNAYDSFVGSKTAEGYYQAALISTKTKVGKTISEKCALLGKAIELSADEYSYHIAFGSALLEEKEHTDYVKAHDEFKLAITSIIHQNSLKTPTAIVKKEQTKNLSQIADGLIVFLNSEDHYDFAEDIAQELISIDENAFPQARSVLKAVAVKRGADYELSAKNHEQIDGEIMRKFSARKFDEVITMSKHMLGALDAEEGKDDYRRRNFYNFMLGKSYNRAGKFNESIIAFDKVPLSYERFHPDIFFERGRAILQDGNNSRVDEAMFCYQNFLEYTARHFNTTEAESSKEYIKRTSSQISRIEDDVARVITSGNSSLAIDAAETFDLVDKSLVVKSQKLVKASNIHHFHAAKDLVKAGNRTEALDELSKISNSTSMRGLAVTGFYSAVGSMYFEAGDYEKALEFYEKQQSFGVRVDKVFYERKGDIYRALKRPEEAVSEYVKAVKYHPNNLNLLGKVVEASEEAGKAPPEGYKERIKMIQDRANSGSQVVTAIIVYGFIVCSVAGLCLDMAAKVKPGQRPNSIPADPHSTGSLSVANRSVETHGSATV